MSRNIAHSTELLLITTITIITLINSMVPTTTNITSTNPPRLIIRPLTGQSTPALSVKHSSAQADSLATPAARSPATKRPANKNVTRSARAGEDKLILPTFVQAAQIYDEDEAEMDPCYDHNSGEAIRCQPEFSDVAFNTTLTTTSQCGSPTPSLHCLIDVREDSYYNPVDNGSIDSSFNWVNFIDLKRHQTTSKTSSPPPSSSSSSIKSSSVKQCFTCNKNNPNTSYPPNHLTDLHNPLNPTCWASAPRVRAVNLTLNLGKKHELTYISVELCPGSRQPDVAIFWKSKDHAKSWTPIKYFSTECQATMANPGAPLTPDAPVRHHHNRRDESNRFHQYYLQRNRGERMFKNKRSTPTAAPSPVTKVTTLPSGEKFQPTCSDIVEIRGQPLKLAFRGSEGHAEGGSLDPDLNPSLSDWITFSDLKLTLYHDHRATRNGLPQGSPEGHEFFAVSNFNVGARCKCNGHASQCIPSEDDDDDEDDEDGGDVVSDYFGDDYGFEKESGIEDLARKYQKMKCACRHNTRGMECERCKPLYNDRPWTRASSRETNECIACNCHGHARLCRFNEQLYKASKEHRSGGVCVRCRHNTAGRFCHVCADGYYRTPGRMLADKRACSSCSCHPIGSTSGTCNRTTGQCPCKRGVAGRSCDRCVEGFQHGNSPAKPCVQIKKAPDISSEKDNLCRIYCKRSWSLTNDFAKQVCRENYIVMQMKVISKKFKVLYSNKKWMKARTWIRYGVEILNVFNKKPNLHNSVKDSKLKETPQKRYHQIRKDQKLPKNAHGNPNLVLPGSKMAAWTRVEDAKDCNCINLRSGFVYLVALPIVRQSRSWQKSDSKKSNRYQTTRRIKVSIPKFRIAGHRDNSDLLRNTATRGRHRMILMWNQEKNKKIPLQTSKISQYSNDSILQSFKSRPRREETPNMIKPLKKSNLPPSKSPSTPKLALARPWENHRKKVIKQKFNSLKPQSSHFENLKKTKKKKADKEMNKVRMNRRSRIRLAHDSLVLAWNAKETKDLFNKLDCF